MNAKQRLSTRVVALEAEVDQLVSDTEAYCEAQQKRAKARDNTVGGTVEPKGGQR